MPRPKSKKPTFNNRISFLLTGASEETEAIGNLLDTSTDKSLVLRTLVMRGWLLFTKQLSKDERSGLFADMGVPPAARQVVEQYIAGEIPITRYVELMHNIQQGKAVDLQRAPPQATAAPKENPPKPPSRLGSNPTGIS